MFTNSLSELAREIIVYVGFNTEEKPWPFDKWPTSSQQDEG